MITTCDRFVVLVRGTRSSDSRARVSRIMRRAVIMSRTDGRKTTARNRNSANLRVAKLAVAVGTAVALPELDAGALSVAVARAGAKRLLLLVVAGKAHLDEGGDEEEEGAEDGDGEAGCVEAAGRAERGGVGDLVALAVAAEAFLGVGVAVAEGRLDGARAAVGAVACEYGDGDHAAAAEKVEDDA